MKNELNEFRVGQVLELKKSKLAWVIFRISDKDEIYLRTNSANDGRSMKCFSLEILRERIA